MANHSGIVPAWLNTPYITKVLSDSLKLLDLKIKTLEITPGSKVGDNYSCQIFRINTIYTSNGAETPISLIAKCMILTKLMEAVGGGTPFFDIESSFYQQISLEVQKYTGNEVGPTVYYVDHENHSFVMEDLVVKGFQLQARDSFLTIEQCYLVIDAVAALHGTSYYLLKENPSLKEKYKVYYWASKNNETMNAMTDNAEIAIKNNIHKYGLSKAHQHKLLGIFETLRKDDWKVGDLHPEKINFLMHGDCWKSNMMFRFNKNTADAVKLLDFQMVNYNCFANELQFFLFSSVETKVLLDNLENILQRYYRKLMEAAPDMPDVTLERIEKEFEERYFFGLALLIVFRGILYSVEPVDIENVVKGVRSDMGYGDPRYIDTVKLILAFFDKAGVI